MTDFSLFPHLNLNLRPADADIRNNNDDGPICRDALPGAPSSVGLAPARPHLPHLSPTISLDLIPSVFRRQPRSSASGASGANAAPPQSSFHGEWDQFQERIRQAEANPRDAAAQENARGPLERLLAHEHTLPTNPQELVSYLLEMREFYRLASRFLRSHPNLSGQAGLLSRTDNGRVGVEESLRQLRRHFERNSDQVSHARLAVDIARSLEETPLQWADNLRAFASRLNRLPAGEMSDQDRVNGYLTIMRDWLSLRDSIEEDRVRGDEVWPSRDSAPATDRITTEMGRVRDQIESNLSFIPPDRRANVRGLLQRLINGGGPVSLRAFLSAPGLESYARSATQGREELAGLSRALDETMRTSGDSARMERIRNPLLGLELFHGVRRAELSEGREDARGEATLRGQVNEARRLLLSGEVPNLREAFERVSLNDPRAQDFLQRIQAQTLNDRNLASVAFGWGRDFENQGAPNLAATVYQVMAQDSRFSSGARDRLQGLPTSVWIRNHVSGFTEPHNIILNLVTMGTTVFIGGLVERGFARAIESHFASTLGRQILGTAVRVSTESLAMPALNNVQHSVTNWTTANWSLANYHDQVRSNFFTLGLFRGINTAVGVAGRGLVNVPALRMPGIAAADGISALRPGVRAAYGLGHYGANLSGFVLAQGINDPHAADHPLLARYLVGGVEDGGLRLSSGLTNTVTGGRLHRIESETQESHQRRPPEISPFFGRRSLALAGTVLAMPLAQILLTGTAHAQTRRGVPAASTGFWQGAYQFLHTHRNDLMTFSAGSLAISGLLLVHAGITRGRARRAAANTAARGVGPAVRVQDLVGGTEEASGVFPLVRPRIADRPEVSTPSLLANWLQGRLQVVAGPSAARAVIPENVTVSADGRAVEIEVPRRGGRRTQEGPQGQQRDAVGYLTTLLGEIGIGESRISSDGRSSISVTFPGGEALNVRVRAAGAVRAAVRVPGEAQNPVGNVDATGVAPQALPHAVVHSWGRFIGAFVGMDTRTRNGDPAGDPLPADHIPMNVTAEQLHGRRFLAITVEGEADQQRALQMAEQRAQSQGLRFTRLTQPFPGGPPIMSFRVEATDGSPVFLGQIQRGRVVGLEARSEHTIVDESPTQVILGPNWESVGSPARDPESGGTFNTARPRAEALPEGVFRSGDTMAIRRGREGNIRLVFRSYPAMARRLDITLHDDGSVTYPDARAANHRLGRAGFGFRFFPANGEARVEDFIAGLAGEPRGVNAAEAGVIYAPYSRSGEHSLHDGGGTHLIGYVLPRAVRDHLRSNAQQLRAELREARNANDAVRIAGVERAMRDLITRFDETTNRLSGNRLTRRHSEPSSYRQREISFYRELMRGPHGEEAARLPDGVYDSMIAEVENQLGESVPRAVP